MKRILHVTEMLQSAGIENFIINLYRNIDKVEVQFDFLVTRNQEEFFDSEIESLGGEKHTIDYLSTKNIFFRILKESFYIYRFLKQHSEYKIIHVHSGTPLRIFYLLAAKLAGCPNRIYHSHSAEVKGPHSKLFLKKTLFKILRLFFSFVGTHFFACSNAAAIWMYPRFLTKKGKVQVINNGVDINKFKFNETIREAYRKDLNLENAFVVGHVGRFNHQKNHAFLIDIFCEIKKLKSNAILLLIGEGELFDTIKNKVENLHLTNSVVFMGVRSDVVNIMQAMDVFLLPSNYEGLPVVGVEAQALGLPCYFSDSITDEISLLPETKFIPLTISACNWSSIIVSRDHSFYKNASFKIKKYGFDIKDITLNIQNEYLKCKI